MPEEKKERRIKIKVEEESAKEEIKSEAVAADVPEGTSKETKNTRNAVKEESVEPKPATSKPPTDKLPVWILVSAFLMGLVLGAGLIGGIFYYRQQVEKNPLPEATGTSAPIAEPTEIPALATSPSASPSAKIDLAKISIQIQNGSGLIGEAGKVEALLKTTGFTKTKTGNASSYDYKETEIAVKESVSDEVYKKITSALADYKTKSVDNLASSSTYDVVITVGSEKK